MYLEDLPCPGQDVISIREQHTNKKLEKSCARVVALFAKEDVCGKEKIKKIQDHWENLATHCHEVGCDSDIGDGILLCLSKIGLSDKEIRSILKVGGSRLAWLRNFTSNAERIAVK